MSLDPLNRRTFLKAGLAAGAGALLNPGVRADSAAAANIPPSETLNVGLIGVGAQGRVLMNAMLQIPGVRFTAVCDIWEYHRRYGERYLSRFGHTATGYEDYREMLAEETDLDAVLVATPDWQHAPQTIAALEAGRHVYCEKMMSNSVEEARQMVLAARRTGKKLQIGHQRRSNPRYIHAYEKLLTEANLFGGPFNFANAQWNRARSGPLRWPERFEMPEEHLQKHGYESMHAFINWRWFSRYGGGPISDLGAHQIDIFNWFFKGRPKGVIASGGKDFYEGFEHLDNAMAIYDYENEAGAARAFYQVLTTTSALGYHERFMGVDGTLSLSENPNWNQAYREAAAPSWDDVTEKGWLIKKGGVNGADAPVVDVRETAALDAWDLPVVLDKPIHTPHLENFFDAIRHNTPLTCPPEEGFASAVTVLRINDAVREQKRSVFSPEDFIV